MLSKFFIDRPIFATVLSVLITLTGFIAMMSLPVAQYPRITPPSVAVSISYPGASAQVVADTVAAPIEQQVTGVPGMLYMSSQMGNDGSYTLQVTFDVGVDLNTALVMVQNRVALANPLLPTPVQNQGITIRKKTPDILMMVSFISPKGKDGLPVYDDIYLSNYVLINVKDEILRVDGVSDISIMGERDYSIRAWLDPQKLAARGMTAVDVANAVQNQNIQAAPGQVGQPPTASGQSTQLPIDVLGRLSQPDQFGDIIVKAAQDQPTPKATVKATRAPSVSVGNLLNGGLSKTSKPGGGGTTGSGVIGIGSSAIGGIGDTSSTNSSSNITTTAPSTTTTSNMAGTTTSGPPMATILSGGSKTGGGANSGGGGTTGGGGNAVGGATLGGNMAAAGSGPIASPAPSVAVVRLRDVGRMEMGALNYNQSCTFDDGPSVGLSVYQLPGTNALDVADRVRAKMKELKKRFPEGVDYTIAYDITPFIRESIGEVYHTLRDAVILVAIVVLMFLQDWRAMILPMIDVPVSLIGTFAVMAVMGYSLNNISMFGLVLAIGIVVDDAIVVLENIERQMAKGFDTRTATIKAMEEISGPIMAITLVLCAVFVPCAFISGITGRFFRQFAVTISASTVISAINALTMTPSRALMIFKTKEGHAHRPEALPWWIFGLAGGCLLVILGPDLVVKLVATLESDQFKDYWFYPKVAIDEDPAEAQTDWLFTAAYFTPGLVIGLFIGWFVIRPVNFVLGGFFRGFNRVFDALTEVYGWTIGKMLRLCAIVLVAYACLLVLTLWIFNTAPTGFVPQQDQGRLIVSVQLPDSAALWRTQDAMKQAVKITMDTPGVAHVIGINGLSFIEQANGSNFGSMFVILDPFAKRQKPELKDTAIMAKLRKAWAAQIKDALVVVSGASPIPGLSVAGGFKVVVEDRGGLGLGALQQQTDKLIKQVKDMKVRKMEGLSMTEAPGLKDVNTQFRANTPQLYMDIDRNKVASLGVSLDDVNQTLEIYLGSLYVNSFNEFGRHWQVTLQAEGSYRSRVADINLLQVRNNQGQMVPLGTLVNTREITGPLFVKRYNLYAAAPTVGSLLPGVSTGDVISGIDDLADKNLPLSMKAEWTELMFMQIKEGNTTLIVFGLAVICVFLALSALYESWTLPLAVILVVPLCILCSVVGVLFTNTSVNIFVQIGLVVLVGLACKNAILVVEFAKQMHLEGMSVFDATKLASKMRLRPILMTSFAFILGVSPLCIASGAGAEMRRSLGTAVFSGMLGVTLFGIFLTPVFFFVIQGIGESRLFSSAWVRWIGSCVAGTFLGILSGFLLGRLEVVHTVWAMIVGGVLGASLTMAAMGIHRTVRGK
jgi:multidrug efflux pump